MHCSLTNWTNLFKGQNLCTLKFRTAYFLLNSKFSDARVNTLAFASYST